MLTKNISDTNYNQVCGRAATTLLSVVFEVVLVLFTVAFGLGGGCVFILFRRYIISRSSFFCCSSNWYDMMGGSS